jgi:hypothetical protein
MRTRHPTSDLRPWLLCAVAALTLGMLLLPPAPTASAGKSCAKHPTRSKQDKRRCRARASKKGQVAVGPAGTATVLEPSPGPAPSQVAAAPESPRSEKQPAEEVAAPVPPVPPSPPFQPAPEAATTFAPDSLWSQPLPASTEPDPDSARFIDVLLAKIAAEQAAAAGPRLGAGTRTPLYRVGPGQPRVPVYLDSGLWGEQLAERFQAGVPIPPGAQPVAGSDRAMTVWQPSTDTYWEFFKMQEALHAPQFSHSVEVSSGCAMGEGEYVYVVTSFNQNGESTADTKGKFAPVGDGGCVTIQWKAVSGATGYRIYRGEGDAPVSYLATVPADSSSFRDDGLALPDGSPPPVTNTAATPGEWHASYGGLLLEASKTPGYYSDRASASGEVLEQSNWGSAATGLPLAAGLITKQDIERGSIDHAVAIGLDNNGGDAILRFGQFAFPAQRTDGRSKKPDSIPEGARLFLDPGLDLDSLELPPLALMLARAAQTYGLIVQDGSMATVVYAEDPAPYMRMGQPNFYQPLTGSNSLRALSAFPWEDLQVADMRLCTSNPCLPV